MNISEHQYVCTSKSCGVLCFYYSRMCIANGTYQVHTRVYVWTYECTYTSSTMSWHSGAKTKTSRAFKHSDPLKSSWV